jgi:lipopolysaccharide assembly protein A
MRRIGLDRKKLVGVRLRGRSRETGSVPVTRAGKPGIGQLWVGLLLSALVLVFLLIFILQNSVSVPIAFFGWDGALPAGVALLFAAIGGVLLVAVPGSVRIAQLRRQARRENTSREPERQS